MGALPILQRQRLHRQVILDFSTSSLLLVLFYSFILSLPPATCTAATLRPSSTEAEAIRHGHAVRARLLSGSGTSADPLRVRIDSADNRAPALVLSLREHHELMNQAARAGLPDALGSARPVWYDGDVEGQPGSAVRVTRHHPETYAGDHGKDSNDATTLVLSGWVRTPTHGIYYLDHDHRNGSTPVVMAHVGEIPHEPEERAHSCGGGVADGGMHHALELNATLGAEAEARARSRRAGPASPAHKVCTVYLDGDNRWLAQWGGDGNAQERESRAISKMISVMNEVSGLYNEARNFAGTRIKFQVAGYTLLGSNLGIPQGTTASPRVGNSVLQAYGQFLGNGAIRGTSQPVRGTGKPTSQDVCLNHLFTHNNCGGTLGVANTASTSPRFVGGICSFTILSGRAVNAGFSTTAPRSDGRVVPAWQTTLVTAHELGHNAGAPHDCCADANNCKAGLPPCGVSPGAHQCYPASGQYLMWPSVTNNPSATNAGAFSPCTKNFVNAVIDAKGECFETEDPCRFGGPCCNANGGLKAAGTLCRAFNPAEPCLAEGRCDGAGSSCPNTPKADGEFCEDASDGLPHAVCSSGECGHIHAGYCASKSTSFGGGCDPPVGFECARACSDSNMQQCFFTARNCNGGLGSWNGIDGTCQYAPQGTPCIVKGTNTHGQCSGGPACVACTEQPNCGFSTGNVDPDPPVCEWRKAANFGACSQVCGGGTRQKTYSCFCDGSASPDASCTTIKPSPETQTCNTQSCCSWVQTGRFLTCSKQCGTGRQEAELACQCVQGTPTRLQGQCGTRPGQTFRACNTQECPPGPTPPPPPPTPLPPLPPTTAPPAPGATTASTADPAANAEAEAEAATDAPGAAGGSGDGNTGAIVGGIIGALLILVVAIIAYDKRGRDFLASRRSKFGGGGGARSFVVSGPEVGGVAAGSHTTTPTSSLRAGTAGASSAQRPVSMVVTPWGDPSVGGRHMSQGRWQLMKPTHVAAYAYEAADEDELSLTPGDKIVVLEKCEESWWKATVDGQTGLVPVGYIEPIVTKLTKKPKRPSTVPGGGGGGSSSGTDGAEAVAGGTATALYDYSATGEAGHLSFCKGDTINLTYSGDGRMGWWEGSREGITGKFPASYVEKSAAATTTTARATTASARSAGGARTKSLLLEGVTESESTADETVLATYRAAYSYEAADATQVSFKVGDAVEILSRDEAEGWWRGRMHGASIADKGGLVPPDFLDQSRDIGPSLAAVATTMHKPTATSSAKAKGVRPPPPKRPPMATARALRPKSMKKGKAPAPPSSKPKARPGAVKQPTSSSVGSSSSSNFGAAASQSPSSTKSGADVAAAVAKLRPVRAAPPALPTGKPPAAIANSSGSVVTKVTAAAVTSAASAKVPPPALPKSKPPQSIRAKKDDKKESPLPLSKPALPRQPPAPSVAAKPKNTSSSGPTKSAAPLTKANRAKPAAAVKPKPVALPKPAKPAKQAKPKISPVEEPLKPKVALKPKASPKPKPKPKPLAKPSAKPKKPASTSAAAAATSKAKPSLATKPAVKAKPGPGAKPAVKTKPLSTPLPKTAAKPKAAPKPSPAAKPTKPSTVVRPPPPRSAAWQRPPSSGEESTGEWSD
eukprot:UC1_evm1s1162